MPKAYETREEFVADVTGLLPRDALPADLRAELAEAIAQANEDWSRDSEGSGAGFELRIGQWFIRDDDLRFFETAGAVGPVVASLSATGALPPAAVVTAAIALVAAAWRVWRKGGRLNEEQLAVLTALQAAGPLTEDRLTEILARKETSLRPKAVRAILHQLEDVELRDGTGVALTRRHADGTWRAVNV